MALGKRVGNVMKVICTVRPEPVEGHYVHGSTSSPRTMKELL
jgi:hypothetical protein